MDSAIFDAFNAHDAERLMAMFTDDLEFYHDTGGLTDYRQSQENFKKLFAGTPDIRRDLVKGSLEVYPIKDHGAIEIGDIDSAIKRMAKVPVRLGLIVARSSLPWSGGKVVSRGKFPA